MAVRSRIKWIALFVLFLSSASIIYHLSIAKSSVHFVPYTAVDHIRQDFGKINVRNERLWGRVKALESLRPYANPRGSYFAPSEHHNGYIYAKVFGGFEKIRSSICDLVTISRLLNATLVIPEIQQSTRMKGISYKFRSFSYLYSEEQFIASLKNDINIEKTLPGHLKAARKSNKFPTFKPKNSASPDFYTANVLPKLKAAGAIGLIIIDGGCLQSVLPPSMSELQRLRCRVAFHALKFRPEIQILGQQMVERLRALGRPYLAYHPGLVRETLAYHGCAELFQDVHTELIQYRRAQMIKQGLLNEELNIDSCLQKRKGLCPPNPEEVGILLRGMGYPPTTIIYLAGSEIFGGQRVLIPLRAMFPNLVDRTSLCSKEEISYLIGPETPISEDSFHYPPAKREKQLKEEWNKAGPRPRPLPPPPDRPIYQHEKEGWYGWITETDKEPDPSLSDLRMQAHRLLWDALDFIVSVEADAFFPGFHNDGSGWPDFASMVMGQRLYASASSRTYRPDRKVVAEYLNRTSDDLYHLKQNWTLLVKEHLNKSLGIEGLIQQSASSRATSFLSHPLPECSCRISRDGDKGIVKGKDGRILYDGEDECPKGIESSQRAVVSHPDREEEGQNPENELEEDESVLTEQLYFAQGRKTDATVPLTEDEEMDPND